MTARGAMILALILFLVVGTASLVLFLVAFGFRQDWFADPTLLLEGGATSAVALRWASLADLFGYYLPTGVVAAGLFVVLRQRDELLSLVGLVGALGYVVAGGAGAATLAMAGPPLIEAYGDASGAERSALAAVFGTMVNVVFRAVWQLLDGVLLSTWMATTGLLVRPAQPGFARLSLVLAGLIGLGVVLNVLELGLARDATLGIVFVLWAAWAIWLIRLVWRRAAPFGALHRASERTLS